jgi:hypothetical protein
MSSEFAQSLSDQLRAFFPITNGEELASIIGFNSKFIQEEQLSELASLLFIEFSECTAPISLDDAKQIVSRVQKRLYRAGNKVRHSLAPDIVAPTYVGPSEVEGTIREFFATLSPEDIILFQLRFTDGEDVPAICKKLGVKKSEIYHRLATIRQAFEAFVHEPL